jgi:hypothetical protein
MTLLIQESDGSDENSSIVDSEDEIMDLESDYVSDSHYFDD